MKCKRTGFVFMVRAEKESRERREGAVDPAKTQNPSGSRSKEGVQKR